MRSCLDVILLSKFKFKLRFLDKIGPKIIQDHFSSLLENFDRFQFNFETFLNLERDSYIHTTWTELFDVAFELLKFCLL